MLIGKACRQKGVSERLSARDRNWFTITQCTAVTGCCINISEGHMVNYTSKSIIFFTDSNRNSEKNIEEEGEMMTKL